MSGCWRGSRASDPGSGAQDARESGGERNDEAEGVVACVCCERGDEWGTIMWEERIASEGSLDGLKTKC